MKKVLCAFLILFILLFSMSSVATGTDEILVYYNSQRIVFDVNPIISGGRTLVPMRAVFEAFGAGVSYNAQTKQITGTKGNREINLTIGDTSAKVVVSGTETEYVLDVPPLVIDGRTLVPLRFIGQALGSTVNWDAVTKTVNIFSSETSSTTKPQMEVHYIDVGQGDSIFINTPMQKILIDGGERGTIALDYVKSLGISTLDLVVSTHPHADHIGGLINILSNLTVKEVIDPGIIHTTQTFEDYLSLIDTKNIKFTEGRAGMTRDLGSGISMKILNPSNPSSSDLNNSSVVVRIVHNTISFLFAGDAEAEAESQILQRGENVKSTILKVGHHGSSTSTSDSFLNAVMPKVAIIMCAEDNSYGHPHEVTLQKLLNANVQIYRTDLHGNIKVKTDGSTYTVTTSKTASANTTTPSKTLTVASYTESVFAGSNASITIKGKANTEYSIKVEYKSGASTASGLVTKKSDASGNATWIWKVGTNTSAGSWPITVSGGGETVKVYFEVIY